MVVLGGVAVSCERGTPVTAPLAQRYPRQVSPQAASSPLRPNPPWRQPRGKSMVSLVNFHTNATRIGWHLWEIDLRFAPGLPPGRSPAKQSLGRHARSLGSACRPWQCMWMPAKAHAARDSGRRQALCRQPSPNFHREPPPGASPDNLGSRTARGPPGSRLGPAHTCGRPQATGCRSCSRPVLPESRR